MRLLLDTHLLVWAVTQPRRLPAEAIRLIEDETNEKLFSAASIWEVAIKSALRRPDFLVDAVQLAETAKLDFTEVAVTSSTAVRVAALPLLHRDPFDRLLVVQAVEKGAVLLTVDMALVPYGAHIRMLGTPSSRVFRT